MRFGVPLTGEARAMGATAHAAEQAGAESVWVPEHLVWPVEIASAYPYSVDSRPPVPPRFPTHDAWVLLASVAAQTDTILLGTSVYVLPLRDPHVTARAMATLDLVSGGRVLAGIGVGWLREEFAAVAQDFSTRGARADEIIEILRGLWSPGPYAHQGSHYSFASVHFEPKPPQGRRLPILIGGESDAALRRAARLGDGWIGLRHTPECAAERVSRLHKLLVDRGRSIQSFSVTVNAPGDVDARAVARYAAAGVDRICLRPWARDEEHEVGLARLARLIEHCARTGVET